MHGRSGCVSQRCHYSPDRKWGKRVWVTSRAGSVRRIWGILKKSVRVLPREKTVGFRLLTEARPVALWRMPHKLGGADGKASIERLCLSPYVEKPFNSKVVKGFVPELRSRYVFFVFRDSYVLCTYVMNILCTFHAYPYPAMV